MADKKLRIKLVKSPIGYNRKQRKLAETLGLKKMNSEVVHYDTPNIRGVVYKVRHLVEVEEFEE